MASHKGEMGKVFLAFNVCNCENSTIKHLHESVMFLILAGYGIVVRYDMGERFVFYGITYTTHIFCILANLIFLFARFYAGCLFIPGAHVEKFGWFGLWFAGLGLLGRLDWAGLNERNGSDRIGLWSNRNDTKWNN